MKLYTSIGPNPRVVNIFLAEKGVDLERETIDLMAGENRQAPHLERNPAGQLPCLQFDDGSHLAEITAICEYLDEVHPNPPLLGTTPEERAVTRMWTRRIDLNIIEPIGYGFRFGPGIDLFKNRIHVIPQAAEDFQQIAQEKLAWLDGLIEGREFITGDRFTLPDILLFAFLEFSGQIGQTLDPKLENLRGWFTRVAARPSVEASR